MTRFDRFLTPFERNPPIGEGYSGESRTGKTHEPILPRSPRPWRNPLAARAVSKSYPSTRLMGLCPECLLTLGMDDETLSLSQPGEPKVRPRWSEGMSSQSVPDDRETSIGEVPGVQHRGTDDAAQPGDQRDRLSDPPPVRRPLPAPVPRSAAGGMGDVFRGHDTDLGRELAFKVLLEEHLANIPTWRGGSSRRPRSAASFSTPAWCRSMSWARWPTTGPSSP